MQGWCIAFRILISRNAVTGMPSFSLCINMRFSATARLVVIWTALWTSLATNESTPEVFKPNIANYSPESAFTELRGRIIVALATAAFKRPSINGHLFFPAPLNGFATATLGCHRRLARNIAYRSIFFLLCLPNILLARRR